MVLRICLVILINTRTGFLVFADAERVKMSDLSSVLPFYLLVVHLVISVLFAISGKQKLM